MMQINMMKSITNWQAVVAQKVVKKKRNILSVDNRMITKSVRESMLCWAYVDKK